MSKLLPIPQTLLAGALATLATGLLVWLLYEAGVFIVLGVGIQLPEDVLVWLLKRCGWGALAGLVFLAPVVSGWPQWKRGLVAGCVPIAALLLVIYPWGPEGWLGLNSGAATPVVAIILWVLWGLIAGWLLDRWRFQGPPDEPMEMV